MIYVFSLNPAIDYHMIVASLVLGETNRSSNESYQIGGKGINVAIVLNHLETETTLLGYEAGFTGAFIKSELVQYPHIQDEMIHVDGVSRINVKLKGSKETEINAQGPSISKDALSQMDAILKTILKDDVVVLNGSLGKDMPKDWYLQLAQYLHHRGIDFVLDIATPVAKDICQYKPLLLKPNHDELEIIFGTKIQGVDELIYYGKKLVSLGAKHVLVSMGAQGSLLITAKGVYQGSNPVGQVVNTVGAGDSMIAGFLYELSKGKPIEEVYKTAIAAGSGTAFSSHLASKELIMKLRDEIIIIKKEKKNEN